MGRDAKLRLKNKMKKNEKHKVKKAAVKKMQQQRRIASDSIPDKATTWPIYECYISKQILIEEQGMGSVVVTRRTEQSRILTSIFLLDLFCLGVKSVIVKFYDESDYRMYIKKINQLEGLQSTSAACAKKLVLGAVEYAGALGFEPHKDYAKAKPILEGIDSSLYDNSFQFGRNGQPFYIPGPMDDEHTQQRVMEILMRRSDPNT